MDSKGTQKLNVLWGNTTASQSTVHPESDSPINIPRSLSQNGNCIPQNRFLSKQVMNS
ncbi:hypothetical protein DPMN_191217 [Dreissena polymorpha]|uniref:Uncharacterized protein n=1 Tax=Dreissena polymorpha TaxID=45954 RepID=A0A9D3Y076_DREPO|nr:hypothetical protein DPMN_191217 [Dreissena polymorpha]